MLMTQQLNNIGENLRGLTLNRKQKTLQHINKLENILEVAKSSIGMMKKELVENNLTKPLVSSEYAARARGKLGGRPSITPESKRFIQFRSLVEARSSVDYKLIYTVPEICTMMHISRNTYYRWLRFLKTLPGVDPKV